MKRTMPLKAPVMQLSVHQVVAIIFCSMAISAHVSAQTDDLVLYWDFDRVADRKVSECVSGTQDALNGGSRLTQGVKGQAADRPSHFSLAWATPNPHQGEKKTYYWTWMYGATRDDPRTLAPLAKSWVRPPELSLASGGTSSRYDSTQRCYVISRVKGAEQGKMEATLKADSEHPVFNPALVIEDWGDRPAHLMVNNERMTPGSDFRTGYVRRVNDYDLVLWLRMKSDRPVTITLSTAP